MAYTKTNWQNGVPPVNADNMNKIENELEALDQASGGTGGGSGGTQLFLHKITSEAYSDSLYFISNKSDAMVIAQGKDYVYCSNFSPTDIIPIISLFNIYNDDSFANRGNAVIKINVGSPRGNKGYFITSKITEDPTLTNALTRVDFVLTIVDTVTPL